MKGCRSYKHRESLAFKIKEGLHFCINTVLMSPSVLVLKVGEYFLKAELNDDPLWQINHFVRNALNFKSYLRWKYRRITMAREGQEIDRVMRFVILVEKGLIKNYRRK